MADEQPAVEPLRAAEIEAIRERAERATPGVWFFEGHEITSDTHPVIMQWLPQPINLEESGNDPNYHFFDDPAIRPQMESDGIFIAAARMDIPRLLATLDAAIAERDAYRAYVQVVADVANPSHPFVFCPWNCDYGVTTDRHADDCIVTRARALLATPSQAADE